MRSRESHTICLRLVAAVGQDTADRGLLLALPIREVTNGEPEVLYRAKLP